MTVITKQTPNPRAEEPKANRRSDRDPKENYGFHFTSEAISRNHSFVLQARNPITASSPAGKILDAANHLLRMLNGAVKGESVRAREKLMDCSTITIDIGDRMPLMPFRIVQAPMLVTVNGRPNKFFPKDRQDLVKDNIDQVENFLKGLQSYAWLANQVGLWTARMSAGDETVFADIPQDVEFNAAFHRDYGQPMFANRFKVDWDRFVKALDDFKSKPKPTGDGAKTVLAEASAEAKAAAKDLEDALENEVRAVTDEVAPVLELPAAPAP